MSVTSISKTHDLRGSIEYVLYGKGEKRKQHMQDGTNRLGAVFCSSKGGIKGFYKEGVANIRHNGKRKIVAYNLIQSFPSSEFSVKNKNDVEFANGLGVELAERLFKGCNYLVVTHVDSDGAKVHNHIIVLNNVLETGKAITKNRSVKAVRACNDDLMRDYGLSTATHGRDFSKELHGDFDLEMIGKIKKVASLSTDFGLFKERLLNEGVQITKTEKNGVIGLTYKMLDVYTYEKDLEEGKKKPKLRRRRRKASKLGHEFTYVGLLAQFEANKKKEKEEEEKRLKKARDARIARYKQQELAKKAKAAQAVNENKEREKVDEDESQNQVNIKHIHVEQAEDALNDDTASNDAEAIAELNGAGEGSYASKHKRPVKAKSKPKKEDFSLRSMNFQAYDPLLELHNQQEKQDGKTK